VANELIALGGAFLAAGLLARIGRGVGLPTIPFFIAAGILTGPHTPGLVLVEDPADLELLAAVGLILLLFHLGLEFSLTDLIAGGRPLLLKGALYIVLNVGGGLLFGLALGWGIREAFVIAGVVGISSSAIVTKLVVELKRLANPETKLVLGIIVVEDIFMALYLAALQPILGGSEGAAESMLLFGRAFAFLICLAVVARYAAGWVGRLVNSNDDELLTVLFVGLAILVAGVATELGVSEAIGAFMIGLILAETAAKHRIERLVLPLRDALAAVFFFTFGLTIDPGDIQGVAGAVAAAVALSLVLNVVAGLVAARRYSFGRRAAANVGLTVLGRGEFSLILATFAAAAGLDRRIAPFTALYVLTLAVLGPLLASRSDLLAAWLPSGMFGAGRVPETPPARPKVTLPQRERTSRGWSAWQTVKTARNRLGGLALGRFRENSLAKLGPPLALLVGVVAYGVAGYMILGHPPGQALLITLSDLTPAEFSGPARGGGTQVFALSVTLLGLIAAGAALVAVVSISIEGGFGLSSRRRRMEERIERLENHYIVCAYGRVGRAAVRELQREGVPFVVIDSIEELEPLMRRQGLLYLIADPTSETVLRQAGIERAKGLVCAVDSDATNVYITLMARSLNPDLYIVARASETDSPERLQRAGANRVISPYTSSGRQMALLVLRPRVVDSLEVLGRRLEELAIEERSPLIGLTIEEACGQAVPLLVHRAGGKILTHPGPHDLVESGDLILAWGGASELRRVETAG
jgi:CPA2 family monovalent cation:H+ antiporter-2